MEKWKNFLMRKYQEEPKNKEIIEIIARKLLILLRI
jgi:hypothetical protein